MINFRYHIVSLIAVFLALAIGVIMGSAVIDRAIVDRLEDQQRGLRADIDDVEKANDTLSEENRELRETSDLLTEQGSQRLLSGTLVDVPVLVLATRGVETEGFDALVSLLATSGADQRGTIWLTERFTLDDDDEVRDLAAVLAVDPPPGAARLRTLALTRLSLVLRAGAGPAVIDDPSIATTTTTPTGTDDPVDDETATVLVALRDAGFIDFDAPEGRPDDIGPDLTGGTRLVLVSGHGAEAPVDVVAGQLATLLVEERSGSPSVALLAAEERADPAPGEPRPAEFVVALREVDSVATRLSTVDNIGDFAGRLASVLAIVDLGDGRVGHYGRGPGAQRLLPAPPESGE